MTVIGRVHRSLHYEAKFTSMIIGDSFVESCKLRNEFKHGNDLRKLYPRYLFTCSIMGFEIVFFPNYIVDIQ